MGIVVWIEAPCKLQLKEKIVPFNSKTLCDISPKLLNPDIMNTPGKNWSLEI